MHQQILLALGGFEVDAADFDGTNDYLRRTTVLSNLSAAQTGIFSCWFKFDTSSATSGVLLLEHTNDDDFNYPGFFISWSGSGGAGADPAGTFRFAGFRNSDSNSIQQFRTGDALGGWGIDGPHGTWHHILASWNRGTGAAKIYVDDVDRTWAINNDANENFPYNTWNNIAICSAAQAAYVGAQGDGGLAELYYAPSQFLDLTTTSNRRKFIDSNGKPVFLGTTGEIPTGTAPALFLHLDNAESAANFASNDSGNGALTVTGTLTTYGSSPSD